LIDLGDPARSPRRLGRLVVPLRPDRDGLVDDPFGQRVSEGGVDGGFNLAAILALDAEVRDKSVEAHFDEVP